MFLFILVGFYYFGTRQFAASFVVCCVLMGVLGSGGSGARFVAILVLCVIGFVLYSFRYQIFGQYIQLTESDVGNEDYIRFLSADFFLKRNWPPGVFPRILGNGAPHSVTKYGAEVLMIQERYRFFASDVGMIGAYNTFGIAYVLNVLSISVKGLRYKLYEKTRMWVPFVFLSSTMLLFISEYFSNASTIPFLCILFYIADLSFKRSKQLKSSVSSNYAKLPRQ
ncbi:hypothetical protein [Dyadobacter sp. CY323]|uniref:hypothetical protein n=1 Tax=Dyadobacter sp. CY323 TaxID=2907302 RepID=UPI001F35ED8D|nr:hypothetical protein [Dyadobacter sp. CY323]MCE6992756.1 hypothetical protein [Dyadobacter sp. CY323]